jgi:hypothetical protein
VFPLKGKEQGKTRFSASWQKIHPIKMKDFGVLRKFPVRAGTGRQFDLSGNETLGARTGKIRLREPVEQLLAGASRLAPPAAIAAASASS